jgi:hypothetical protein
MSEQRSEKEIIDEAYGDEAAKTWRAPVQGYPAGIPWPVHLEAYAAYCKRWSKQTAMIDLKGRHCRGGFGTAELDELVPGWLDRVSYIGRLEARIAELEAAKDSPVSSSGWEDEEKLTVEQAWTRLCETPDITSPEEYPDHALITMEQLGSFMARAKLAIPDGWKLMPSDPGESWHGTNTAFEAYQSGYQDGRKIARETPTPAPKLSGG